MIQTTPKVNMIQDEIINKLETIQRWTKEIVALTRINVMLAGVDLSCVGYTDLSVWHDSAVTFTMRLSEEHKNVRLASVLARHFRVKFEKEQNWSGDSLDVSATVTGIKFVVAGYVPTTCHIIEETRELTDEEYQQKIATAVAQVKRVVVTDRKIVCK